MFKCTGIAANIGHACTTGVGNSDQHRSGLQKLQSIYDIYSYEKDK